jgi:hypothetical protein
MSVLVIKIKDNSKISEFKKAVAEIFGAKANVLTDEEYRDSKLAELLEEGLKSDSLTASETRKEFKKRGVSY